MGAVVVVVGERGGRGRGPRRRRLGRGDHGGILGFVSASAVNVGNGVLSLAHGAIPHSEQWGP